MNGFSSDKKFRRPFDRFIPLSGECDWVEETLAVFFFVPHDVQGLMIGLHGSPDALLPHWIRFCHAFGRHFGSRCAIGYFGAYRSVCSWQ